MPTVKSRREQYSEETRAALLDAATRRFAEHGFGGTSLEDVAADIRATRGAVYHHFANKTALFQAVFERLEGDMMRALVEAAERKADAWDAAIAALNRFLDGCCDPVYGRLVWQEAPIALGWQRWRECEAEYAYGFIERLLRRLMADGGLAPLPLEPTAHVVFHVLGAAGMALAEAPEPDKPRVREEYTQVIGRLMAGMRD
ncbi:TetR/AcrR family transcriptional regulator [Actinomadura hibisca]|uniref:TetR/AcrR family transcriptional regulator n=1 Tax=Actinomadura hibisca TaxID=68565 RepID=UPI00082AB2F9|nr:TetR family transcriptional regulator [Actinomadura hibisca]